MTSSKNILTRKASSTFTRPTGTCASSARPSGDFEAYVQLAGEMGFWMIVRPGPFFCAEWERGWFPRLVAAMRFPLRTNRPESVRSSQHWFGQVLPVVQRHLVTRSGPIILVQLENE